LAGSFGAETTEYLPIGRFDFNGNFPQHETKSRRPASIAGASGFAMSGHAAGLGLSTIATIPSAHISAADDTSEPAFSSSYSCSDNAHHHDEQSATDDFDGFTG
jgi:hypothetical protein